MFQKLEAVEKRYEELNKKIADPNIIAKTSEWTEYMKEHAEIEEVVLKYKEYKKIKENLIEAEEMLKDPEMKELAEEEIKNNKEKIPQLEEELKILLIPKDPDDDKNTICEIRAGAGGEEAALFAGTLFRMAVPHRHHHVHQDSVKAAHRRGCKGFHRLLSVGGFGHLYAHIVQQKLHDLHVQGIVLGQQQPPSLQYGKVCLLLRFLSRSIVDGKR